MKNINCFLSGVLAFGCSVIALSLLLGGVSCLVTGVVGVIDCFTGGNYFSYSGSGIMIAVGAVLIIILKFLPDAFYDRLNQ